MGFKSAPRGSPAEPWPIPIGATDEAFVARAVSALGSPARTSPLAYLAPREFLGVPAAPDLAALIDAYRTRVIEDFGHLRIWDRDPSPLPTATDAAALRALYNVQPTIVAALTNTVALGCDPGGQVYHARVDPAGSEVFLFSPGVGELALLADSTATFMALNELMAHCQELERRGELDACALIDGKAVPGMALAGVRAALRALDGRVHLADDSDVISDFDELFRAIAEMCPTASTDAPTSRACEGAGWLIAALDGTYVDPREGEGRDYEAERAEPGWWSLACVRVYWLWHLYLWSRDQDLTALLREVDADPAALVRGTAALVRTLCQDDRAGALGRFSALRAIVSAVPGFAGGDPAGHAEPLPGDSPAIAAAKRAAAEEPEVAGRWDALLYAYFGAERFADMADAAAVRLGISADDYYPWLQLGIAHHTTDAFDDAIAAYNRALVYRRSDATTWLNLAMVYASLGERTCCLDCLREALRYNPGYAAIARDCDDFEPYRSDPAFRALTDA